MVGSRLKIAIVVVAVVLVGVVVVAWPGDAEPGPESDLVASQTTTPKEPDIELVSQGEEVDIDEFLRPGHETLIEFTKESDEGCAQVSAKVEALARRRGWRLRTIDIGDFDSSVAQQYEITEVPVVWLFRGTELKDDDYKRILRDYRR